MSVRAFVDSPKTENEKMFSIGISTEEAYNTVILPIAEQNALDLCEYWGIMTTINSSNIDEFKRQIDMLRAGISKLENIDQSEKIYWNDKLSMLPDEFRAILAGRQDAVIIIG